MKNKTWVFIIVGVVLLALGALWTLQGLGTIGGSFMSGQKVWFAIGLLVAIAGITSVLAGVRRGRSVPR
jgi:hypothetical protein